MKRSFTLNIKSGLVRSGSISGTTKETDYTQGRIKSLRGPRALKNVVVCGCVIDVLLFM
jgi:hypothetical protein